jgi:hypothetical protein
MHPMDSQVRKQLATDRIERLRGDASPQGGDLGLARRAVAGLVPAVHAVLEAPNALAQRAPKLGQPRRAEHDQRNQEHDRQFLG